MKCLYLFVLMSPWIFEGVGFDSPAILACWCTPWLCCDHFMDAMIPGHCTIALVYRTITKKKCYSHNPCCSNVGRKIPYRFNCRMRPHDTLEILLCLTPNDLTRQWGIEPLGSERHIQVTKGDGKLKSKFCFKYISCHCYVRKLSIITLVFLSELMLYFSLNSFSS